MTTKHEMAVECSQRIHACSPYNEHEFRRESTIVAEDVDQLLTQIMSRVDSIRESEVPAFEDFQAVRAAIAQILDHTRALRGK